MIDKDKDFVQVGEEQGGRVVLVEQGVAGFNHDQRFAKLTEDSYQLVPDADLRHAIVTQVLKTLVL